MRASLLGDLFRDLSRLSRMGARPREVLFDPGAWSIAAYRVGRKIRALPRPLRVPLLLLHFPWELFLRTVTGVDLSSESNIGGGLYLGHIGDISIAPGVHLGRDVNLSHGAKVAEGGRDGERGVPFVGDRVYIGPGARVFGPIRVGNDVAIAANAVVNRDVPDGAVVSGAPAAVVSMRGSKEMVVKGRKLRPIEDGLRAALRKYLPKPLPLLVRP